MPTFRDIAEESVQDSQEETTPVQPQAEEPKEEEHSESEGQEEIEAFAEKVPLTGKTPEELEAIYDKWQKSYQQKRQKETAEIRELRQRNAEYEQRLSTQPTTQQVEQAQQDVQQQFELGNLTVEQYTAYMQELSKEAAKAVYHEEREQERQETAFQDFIDLDTRLDSDSPTFNERMFKELNLEMSQRLAEHLEKHQTAKGFNAKRIGKEVIERYDKELDEIVKTRTQQSTQAARMRAAKFSKANPQSTSAPSTSTQGKSFRDILEESMT
jgi:hypothetical protein